MKKRPLAVTTISCLYVVAGTVGVVYHIGGPQPFDIERVIVLSLNFLAIAGGVFAFLGVAWARWLLVVWIAFHTVLSLGHPVSEIVMHSVILAATGYLLFNSRSSRFFQKHAKPS